MNLCWMIQSFTSILKIDAEKSCSDSSPVVFLLQSFGFLSKRLQMTISYDIIFWMLLNNFWEFEKIQSSNVCVCAEILVFLLLFFVFALTNNFQNGIAIFFYVHEYYRIDLMLHSCACTSLISVFLTWVKMWRSSFFHLLSLLKVFIL